MHKAGFGSHCDSLDDFGEDDDDLFIIDQAMSHIRKKASKLVRGLNIYMVSCPNVLLLRGGVFNVSFYARNI